MKEIRQIIQAYEAARKRAVLATVVHIEGSAYRAPGARMLILEDGTLTGAVSGGCLEGDVLRKALLVMSEDKPLLVTYDTSDEEDAVIGVSLGCNGIIRILLEPMSAKVLQLLQQAVTGREPAILVTYFSLKDKKRVDQGTRLVYRDNGTSAPADLEADIARTMASGTSAFVQYSNDLTAFIEYIAPLPHLVIAGAGNDVMPLVQMAAILGWPVTLVDGRPAYANTQRFPGCQLLISKPEEALGQLQIDAQTAIVLTSHNYEYDKAILAAAIDTAARYIGLLGPHKKKVRLVEELSIDTTRLYGPTGLDIGAETPEEIALSVIGEIKAVFAQRKGGSLRDINGHIHTRQTQIVPPMQDYGIVLLAAGKSSRLGQPKQQLVYEGDTLLRNAVRSALGTGAHTVVVTSDDDAQLSDLPVAIVHNADAAEGMASSIRTGVRYLLDAHPTLQYVMVMVCDQPYVNTAHLQALIAAQQASSSPVAASFYAGRKGVPALFHRSLFPQLLALKGDTGAKHLIATLGDGVVVVPFPEGAIDVDTEEAYKRLV
ncbi:NTP transferase domain-containing protein [Chitinophaga horti]|uniref:NTP transferase domain-containing protein n=1 Tax=Chitinophaga horti TaxID=2920382 RepID=A0ABY6J842_9BACT|nr:NTP transferase domain-containing protein [Chitinophaga horti]UYQ95858.1 NTP transferase domain-containing protein [Chitinophaga horti]